MLKYLLALLVIAALAFGIYYSLFGKAPYLDKLALNNSQVQNPIVSQKQGNTEPTPTIDISDGAIDSDLTALEKDLADIEKDNVNFTQDLNSL